MKQPAILSRLRIPRFWRLFQRATTSRKNRSQPQQGIELKPFLQKAAVSLKPPKTFNRTFHHWWLEILASALTITSFSGLAATLRAYQNSPVPKWPLGFSFNTALSVISLLFRAPTVFIAGQGLGQLKWHWISEKRQLSDLTKYDEASRGPWGSTVLLWTARWRDITAFLGAFITVTALGMDPFTQAVVSYYDCKASDQTGISSINRTNSYFHHGIRSGYGYIASARVAIDASFGDASAIMPDHTCSADSCEFLQPYHSIGLCSNCFDVTKELVTSCTSERLGGCSYSLPAPLSSSIIENTTASFNRAYTVDVEDPNSIGYQWDILSVQKYLPYIESREVTNREVPSQLSSTIDLVSALPVLGARCLLYYCVKTYTASIDGGVLRERLQSTSNNWSQYTFQAPVLGTVRVDCLSDAVQSKLIFDNYISRETEWMGWNGSYLSGTEAEEQISLLNEPSIPVHCAYQAQLLNDLLRHSPTEDFSDTLTGVLEATGEEKRILFPAGVSSLLSWLYQDGQLSIHTLNQAFENFTTVATNYIRRTNNPIPKNVSHLQFPGYNGKAIPLNPVQGKEEDWNHAATGLAFRNTSCIHVRWAWFSLPAVLFLSTLVFLAVVAFQSSNRDAIEVWKSSQNALLWHGLKGPTVAESISLETVEKMNRRAEEITVHLQKTQEGWKIMQD